jgi:uncharacterized membrane protein YoaK (UPF0700 family)
VKSPLRFAALLCAGGSLLDSFTWVAHGHVFASAQTGNIILFGVFAAQDDWRQALRHVPPMLAFSPAFSRRNGCPNGVSLTTRRARRLSASGSRLQS